MKRIAIPALATLVLTLAGHGQESKTLDVQVVKYGGLQDLVLKHRGKVVLVDVWFTL